MSCSVGGYSCPWYSSTGDIDLVRVQAILDIMVKVISMEILLLCNPPRLHAIIGLQQTKHSSPLCCHKQDLDKIQEQKHERCHKNSYSYET